MPIPRLEQFHQQLITRRDSTDERFMFVFDLHGNLIAGHLIEYQSSPMHDIFWPLFGNAVTLYNEMIADESGDWKIL